MRWYVISTAIFLMLVKFCRFSMTTALHQDCSTDSEFSDVPSRTVLSSIVFEGQTQIKSTSGTKHQNTTTFEVKKLLKGELEKNLKGQYHAVVIGWIGDDVKECHFDVGSLKAGSRYVIFADEVVELEPTTSNAKEKLFRFSSSPELVSKKILKDVQEHSCPKCGKVPTVKVSPKKKVELKSGDKVTLTCKHQGKPVSNVKWLKNNEPMISSGRTQLKNAKQNSRMIIKNAKPEDSGMYKCIATNVLGTSSDDVNLIIGLVPPPREQTTSPSTSKPHAERCRRQDFCFNGGSCYRLLSLRTQFCECTADFGGERCSEKRVDIGKVSERQTEPETLTNEFRFILIVVGGIAATLVVIVVFILLCLFCRMKLKKRMRKGEMKERNELHSSITYQYLGLPPETIQIKTRNVCLRSENVILPNSTIDSSKQLLDVTSHRDRNQIIFRLKPNGNLKTQPTGHSNYPNHKCHLDLALCSDSSAGSSATDNMESGEYILQENASVIIGRGREACRDHRTRLICDVCQLLKPQPSPWHRQA